MRNKKRKPKTKRPGSFPLDRFPVEILEIILGYLTFLDFVKVFRISKTLSVLAFEESHSNMQMKFNATIYGSLLSLIRGTSTSNCLTTLYECITQNPKSDCLVRDLFKALLPEFCEVKHPD